MNAVFLDRPNLLYVDRACGGKSNGLVLDASSLLNITLTYSVKDAITLIDKRSRSTDILEKKKNIFDALIMGNPYSTKGYIDHVKSEHGYNKPIITCEPSDIGPLLELLSLVQSKNKDIRLFWDHIHCSSSPFGDDRQKISSETDLRDTLSSLLHVAIPHNHTQAALAEFSVNMNSLLATSGEGLYAQSTRNSYGRYTQPQEYISPSDAELSKQHQLNIQRYGSIHSPQGANSPDDTIVEIENDNDLPF